MSDIVFDIEHVANQNSPHFIFNINPQILIVQNASHFEPPSQITSHFEPRHSTYLLQSISYPNSFYIGYSVDIYHRLRQHNGEIVGGAKKTRYKRPWQIICHISGFGDKVSALQFEWKWQHPTGKRRKGRKKYYSSNTHHYKGVRRGIFNLYQTLNMKQWTPNARPATNYNLTVHWHILPALDVPVLPKNIAIKYIYSKN